MKELFKIGNFGIYFFGVAIVIGALTGMAIIMTEAKRKKINTDEIFNLAIYTFIASIIGARLYYILVFNLEYYLENPKAVLFLREGGLSIQGGLIGGFLFAIWYTKKKEIFFWRAADVFSLGIIMGQAIGRIGCDVFGVPMKEIYPWGIEKSGQVLHPVQLYEAILDLILFMYLWRKRKTIKYEGQLFIHYIIGFSIIRGTVELFRENPIIFGSFTVVHATSVVVILIAICISFNIKNKWKISKENAIKRMTISDFIEYLGVVLIGVVGTVVYYYMQR